MRKKIISLLIGTTIISGNAMSTFAANDIGGHWSENPVKQLISENVINGYDDGTFRPDELITREQTAKIADTYFNKLVVDKNVNTSISDINDRWSEKNIRKLISAGIITGYPNRTFMPENNIKRSEVAAIAYKALENSGKYVNNGKDVKLSDISGSWAEKYIKALVQMGVINGYEDGSFKPDNNITRAEVASIFSKMNINYYIRSGNALSEEDQNKYFRLYSGVLERYNELISRKRTDYNSENGETGVFEIVTSNEEGTAPEIIGYAIEDINGDKVPELIIGVIAPDSSPYHHGETVLAAYTIADGKPVLSFDGWARSSYRYIGDGNFNYFGSGGAMYTSFGTFNLSLDGKSLECINYYFTDEKVYGSGIIGYYSNTLGIPDKSKSNEINITSDEFWKINDGLDKNYHNIKLTPFSKYKYLMTVNAQLASDFQSNVSEYHNFVIKDKSIEPTDIILFTRNNVTQFKILSFSPTSTDENGNIQFSENVLYTLSTLTPTRPLKLSIPFDSNYPYYGISYVDENGVTKTYSIGMDTINNVVTLGN